MGKNNDKAASPIENLDFQDEMMDHPVVQWLSYHRQTILYAFLALVTFVAIAYWILSKKATDAETAYLQATTEFNRFQDAGLAVTEPAAHDEAFAKLQQLMGQYTDLHAKYDGLLAETLIIEDKSAEAQRFAQLAFDRTQHDDSPFYADFANTSLLISGGSYTIALQDARSLQEKMATQLSDAQQKGTHLTFGVTVFALNLIRIAFVQQQLGDREGELKAWEEVKRLTVPGKFPFDQVDLKQAFDLFSEGKATLLGYIENRMRALGSNKRT
jgi:hypothetical protein